MFSSDDEGQDLFTKRGNEFKLPYPLLDIDLCAGFGFADEELNSKTKSKSKKKCQGREFSQNSRKRKGACLLNGFNNNYPYPYDTGEFKSDIVYPYGSNNFGFDTDIYRSHGYGPLTGSVYPSTDSYRLEAEKHGLSNGYYLDHRQYQPSLPYPTNGYAEIMATAPKYGYDIPKYGYDTYSIDLTKKGLCGEDLSHFENDSRKFGYDIHPHDRFPTRFNGSLEPVDLRSAAVYNTNNFMNPIEGSVAPQCITSPAFFRTVHNQNFYPRDAKLDKASSPDSQDLLPSIPLTHSSVIKSVSSRDSAQPSINNGVSSSVLPSMNSDQNKVSDLNCSSWTMCVKGQQMYNGGSSGSGSDRGTSPAHSDLSSNEMHSGGGGALSRSSPKVAGAPASVIHMV